LNSTPGKDPRNKLASVCLRTSSGSRRKQVAPRVTRLAVLRNSATPTGPAQFGIIQAMAPSLRVEVSPINVRDAAEIEQGINAFARSSNDGLIVTRADQPRVIVI
jgi:putative ABC transport system substrate-binding protein